MASSFNESSNGLYDEFPLRYFTCLPVDRVKMRAKKEKQQFKVITSNTIPELENYTIPAKFHLKSSVYIDPNGNM